MDYVRLGHSGLSISRLSFGAMTFGQASTRGFRADLGQADADAMVAASLDAGVNLFDTADVYSVGMSEEILGAALAKLDPTSSAIVATKVGAPMGRDRNDSGLSYRHIVRSCEASLRRLGREAIDLYQLHVPDFVTPIDETLRALDDLRRRGLIRYAGWSNFPAWYAAEARARQDSAGHAPFVSAQVYYSLVGRDLEVEVLPWCRQAGVGVLVWSPLAGGFLSGKYGPGDQAGVAGRRVTFDFPPVDKARGYQILETLQTVAADHQATVAQVALAWLLHRDDVSSIIIGANTPAQLAENLAASSLTLSSDALAALSGLSAPVLPYPHWLFGRPAATDAGELRLTTRSAPAVPDEESR